MPSATTARGGARKTWTRDKIITALKRYADLYGDDFTAASFSPSSAKWNDHPELAERYFAGDPETGAPWPSLNAVKDPFNGSFNEAKLAAGLPVNKPGPSRGKRPAGTAAPIRDVRHVTRTVVREVDGGEARRRAERAEAKVARLSAKVERLEAALREKPRGLAPAPKTITKTKTKTHTVRVKDEVAFKRAEDRHAKATAKIEARLADAREAEKLARVDLAEARQAATRAASKLERAEATIHGLRDERRDLRAELSRAEDRATVAERERDAARARPPERVEVTKHIVKESPSAVAVREAEHRADRAVREAHEAELRAARAEREYMEIAAAVKGEPRKLTKAELNALRSKGPAGPAVLAKALKALAAARATNNKTALFGALTQVASAAVTWKERL